LSILDYLKESGVPCKVTLNFLDENSEPIKKRGLPINLNKIPMGIIDSEINYTISIRFGYNRIPFYSYNPTQNQLFTNYIEEFFKSRYNEYMINEKRWNRLDDILNDPNPPTQVPD